MQKVKKAAPLQNRTMPATEFLERIISRLDRIDRKSLEHYVQDLARQTQFLTSLINQSREGILVLSFDKETLFLNHRIIQLFNIPEHVKQKEKLGQLISDQPFVEFVSNAIEKHEEIFQSEFEVLLPRPMILRINLSFDETQIPHIAILSIANVTQVETNIRERFQTENWESMLGLAAGIAHEIGNPLNSLTIHLKLLSKSIQKLPPQERKKVETSIRVMEDETARLDRIVRNFLKATRRKPLRYELGQINDLLSKTIAFLKPELKTSKIKVVEEFDKQIPIFLFDSERIQQVFINIIKNAIHAMPKGGMLRAQIEAKGKLCLIHFQDTGIGIPDDKLSKIFDAYYTTREEGSGLGLMIVYQIIREHGGRIEVASAPNTGTTFTVILPIRTKKLSLPEPERRQVK